MSGGFDQQVVVMGIFVEDIAFIQNLILDQLYDKLEIPAAICNITTWRLQHRLATCNMLWAIRSQQDVLFPVAPFINMV